MTAATMTWDAESGFWTVTDEPGNLWDVVATGDQCALLVREDGEQFYGALWHNGAITRYYRDGETADGFDCNDRYTFSPLSGWTAEGGAL